MQVLRPSPPAGGATANVLIQGLRESLPGAQPLAQTLNAFNAKQPQLPPTQQTIARALVAQLPIPGNLSAEGVKAALNQSGVFLENKLLKLSRNPLSTVNINQDIKAQLLRLKQSLPIRSSDATSMTLKQPHSTDLLSQLSSKTQNAIDAISTNQIKSLMPGELLPLFVDLDVKTPDGRPTTIKMRIREENSAKSKADEQTWRFDLDLALDKLGEISVQTTLRGDNITVRFWVESKGIKDHLEQQSGQLQQTLYRQTARTATVAIYVGHPPSHANDPMRNAAASTLMDFFA